MKNQEKLGTFSQFEAPIANTKPARDLNLAGVFSLISEGSLKEITQKIHSKDDQKEKARLKTSKLPYVCFSGVFEKRSNKALLSYSGLLTLDFDELENVEEVFDLLINDKLIDLRLLFRSPSGNGLKAIVRTNGKQEDHLYFFKAYSNYVKAKYDLIVDGSGKDIARACFLCHDPSAQYFEQTEELRFPVLEWSDYQGVKTAPKGRMDEFIQIALRALNDQGVDITKDYHDWIALGFALADEFGESGREFFHQFSSLNDNYKPEETDRKYSNLLNAEGSGITIKSLFHLLGKYQIDVKLPRAPYSNGNNKLEEIENWIKDRFELRYNQLRGTIELKSIGEPNWTIINDRLFNSMLIDIKRDGLRCSSDLLNSLINSDFVPAYHPFKDYLARLPEWDGKDHIGELAQLLRVENKEFWLMSFKKWMVGTVASLLEPKAINQQVIVLCGPQGIGKTTWIMNLIPNQLLEYVYSGTINPNNKDSLSMLAEMILINLDEMDNMNRSDHGSLKSLITTRQVTLRKAYGKFNETKPRLASFVGSVNDRQFLNDPTGSRRFLVIDVLEIDYQSSFDLGQVYQQAVHLYQTGFKYYFDPEEIKSIELNNASFQKTSIEEDLLLKYFEPVEWEKCEDFRTATEILQHFNSYSTMNYNQNHANQIGKALAKHDFEKRKKDGVYKWAVKPKV